MLILIAIRGRRSEMPRVIDAIPVKQIFDEGSIARGWARFDDGWARFERVPTIVDNRIKIRKNKMTSF